MFLISGQKHLHAQLIVQGCPKTPVFLPEMPECQKGDYVLKFADEFNGDSLDLEVWENVVWRQGSADDEQHWQYFSLDNVEVSDGTCKIIAKKETVWRRAAFWKEDDELLEDGRPNFRSWDYTSGSLWTKKKYFYGKYEIRCRLPDGEGMWPAFWMYRGDTASELDVFDNYRNTNDYITGVGHAHFQNPDGTSCAKQYHSIANLTKWHVYTCIFDEFKIIWQLDGETIREYPRFTTYDGNPVFCGDEIAFGTYLEQQAYPRDSMSIIFNLALQAGEHAPDETTKFPAVFEVDYIRFYEFVRSKSIKLKAYPNPTEGIFQIESELPIEKIALFDLTGKLLREWEQLPKGVSEFDISGFEQGIYFFRAIIYGEMKLLKIVKF
ncbi:MAG: family 16 glycosylhydrolase [Salibacteraceae bacterium]